MGEIMRQALHIFRKDIHRAWPQIAVVLAMTAVVAWQAGRGRGTELFPLLVLSWFYLIASLVFAEPAVGDRQFWVTRPYSWKSLLAAKLLAIVLFINVPALIADIAMLLAQGLSPIQGASNLLWRQVFVTTILVAPPLAIAAITDGLAQFAGAVLGILVFTLLVYSSVRPTGNSNDLREWVMFGLEALVIAAGSAIISLRQYARRGLLQSGFVVSAVAILWSGLVWAGGLGGDSSYSQSAGRFSGVRLTIVPDEFPNTQGQSMADVGGEIVLPIRMDGLPAGAVAQIYYASVQFGNDSLTGSHIQGYEGDWRAGERVWIHIPVGGRDLEEARAGELHVLLQFSATIYRISAAGRGVVGEGSFVVPGFGRCRISRDTATAAKIACQMPFRPEGEIATRAGTELAPWGYAPIRAVFTVWPFYQTDPRPLRPEEAGAAVIELVERHPLAGIERELYVPHDQVFRYLVSSH